MEKKVDVKKRYSQELNSIAYILQNLENGRYYEKSGAKMDGYLANNIIKLRNELDELLDKIEYGKESVTEELGKAISESPLG